MMHSFISTTVYLLRLPLTAFLLPWQTQQASAIEDVSCNACKLFLCLGPLVVEVSSSALAAMVVAQAPVLPWATFITVCRGCV